ncbi:MAG: hypothetical protein QGI60_05350 [archaeon]|jgi:hypothetical protein|nr:hypothetical protein [archaeon]
MDQKFSAIAIVAVIVLAAAFVIFLLQPPEEPEEPGPVLPPVDEEPSLCTSTVEETAECKTLFEERMNNVDSMLNAAYLNLPPEFPRPPIISTESARTTYSEFLSSYSACSPDVLQKRGAVFEELRILDKELQTINWDNTLLNKILCVGVSE